MRFITLKRLIFIKFCRFKLSFGRNRLRLSREQKRIIIQAIHYNKMVTARGYGTYRSVVLAGRRY